MINDDLLNQQYINEIVFEIEEELEEEEGIVSIVQLAQRFSLPSDFLHRIVLENAEKSSKYIVKNNELYTEMYIKRCEAMIRGVEKKMRT